MIKEFLIGLLVFVIVTLVIFQSATEFNDGFNVEVNETEYDYGTKETNDLMTSIGTKAPGGADSGQGTGGDIETDTDLGFKTGATIIGDGIPLFKNIVFGTNESGREGLLAKMGVRHEFATLLVAGFLVIIALILISSLLRNVIK